MNNIVNFPALMFLCSFIVLLVAALLGDLVREKSPAVDEQRRQDLTLLLGATLTLLALFIGFVFSMAVTRYDLRKNYEEAEANAIGTEYVRADLLGAADAVRTRNWLKVYLNERVLFYRTRDTRQLAQIDVRTGQLQAELWSSVQSGAVTNPTPVVALAVSGMNDVLNSEGYTQAAWWNRIPFEAWALMTVIALACSFLLGYCAHRRWLPLFLILPLAVSTSFFLVADIDSPNAGIVRVVPHNLVRLANALNGK